VCPNARITRLIERELGSTDFTLCVKTDTEHGKRLDRDGYGILSVCGDGDDDDDDDDGDGESISTRRT